MLSQILPDYLLLIFFLNTFHSLLSTSLLKLTLHDKRSLEVRSWWLRELWILRLVDEGRSNTLSELPGLKVQVVLRLLLALLEWGIQLLIWHLEAVIQGLIQSMVASSTGSLRDLDANQTWVSISLDGTVIVFRSEIFLYNYMSLALVSGWSHVVTATSSCLGSPIGNHWCVVLRRSTVVVCTPVSTIEVSLSDPAKDQTVVIDIVSIHVRVPCARSVVRLLLQIMSNPVEVL
jgi:hypothetical protein